MISFIETMATPMTSDQRNQVLEFGWEMVEGRDAIKKSFKGS